MSGLAFEKGSVMCCMQLQSEHRQMMTDLSSDWLAKKLPAGSQAMPFTYDWWFLSTVTCRSRNRMVC